MEEGIYSDSDELGDEELEEEGEEEIISMGIGRVTLRLGAELVISECVEEEDIKVREDLLANRKGKLKGA